MMQMMSDLKSVKTLNMHGKRSSDVNWIKLYWERANTEKPTKFIFSSSSSFCIN